MAGGICVCVESALRPCKTTGEARVFKNTRAGPPDVRTLIDFDIAACLRLPERDNTRPIVIMVALMR